MSQELEKIKEQYARIAKTINAPLKFINFYDKPQDLGYAHVEYKDGFFFYVVTEKGMELERRKTCDENELLFWLIRSLTSDMASEYEKNNRDNSEDFRRKYFSKNLEILKAINPKWAEIERHRYNTILVNNPFSDNKNPRFL
jgi:hypothetical protein